jgi:hypothetical protein
MLLHLVAARARDRLLMLFGILKERYGMLEKKTGGMTLMQ